MLYVIYREDKRGPQKWATFDDKTTAEYNAVRWQRRANQNLYRPFGPVTFTIEIEE